MGNYFLLSAPSDFQSVNDVTITFPPSETERQVLVTVTNDAVFECDETFQGVLSLVTGSLGVELGVSAATATIEDDDSKWGTLVTPIFSLLNYMQL